MKCGKCFKKGITIQCMTCTKEFCTGCIQLEVHSCEMMMDKIKKDLEILEKKNQKAKKLSSGYQPN
jgi:hypothetical protein